MIDDTPCPRCGDFELEATTLSSFDDRAGLKMRTVVRCRSCGWEDGRDWDSKTTNTDLMELLDRLTKSRPS